MHVLLLNCIRLCNSMDCKLPGSSVHEILQARILGCLCLCFLLQGIFLSQGLNPSLQLVGDFFTAAPSEKLFKTRAGPLSSWNWKKESSPLSLAVTKRQEGKVCENRTKEGPRTRVRTSGKTNSPFG